MLKSAKISLKNMEKVNKVLIFLSSIKKDGRIK